MPELLTTDIIAAIATPPGRGGVGIVRVSGKGLSSLILGVTGRKTLPPRQAVHTAFYDAQQRVLDQGLALFFAAPQSYTGEDVLELHGHGGVAVMRALLERCLELGARLAQPGEFTRRAFLNDKLDLAQAEAVADLIDAATGMAARAAARSLSGAFSAEVQQLVDALVETRMHVEASLDFPEEDLDSVLDPKVAARVAVLTENIDALLARARAGALLREGLTVVLIGAPNVGKSSLLNRLAREEAAIVTPIAGTTRDTIERQIALGGIPLTVVDTAGLRDTDDAIEKIGIARTWAAIERADLALFLTDAQHMQDTALPATDAAILARLPETMPRILVCNKSDLLSALVAIAPSFVDAVHALRMVSISAKTGDGLDALENAVLDAVGVAHLTEDTFLARARHLEALQRARHALHDAAQELAGACPALELAAEQLRLAQEALDSITGAFSADDLLGVIFSRFCIGK
ncbi:MAG: tRNA uridine-5-carboxymethylaminomethyl(34) synthesis GTPase MnmE [Proteobacteria bacterium]|nr:tRNA uridine-5-carboxymethylaminomethyl(34) synthesis GTPase MnmE [Pseudomonadota bacterium]MCL2308459.1 tRNA uridine-5-carboxymethylaminomethyl(34) synthesis GTPase MnmE [Pseudomonadota bacterium]